MRLLRYLSEHGPQSAVVVGESMLDLPGSITDLAGDPAAVAAAITAADPAQLRPRHGVQLLPPTQPGKIVCVGYNYRGHVRDGHNPDGPDPDYPDFFIKTSNVLIGETQPVLLPQVDADVDYEAEIAVVIGRRTKNVPLPEALAQVAGYTVFNDVTARDWQRRSSQFTLGKCFDTFGPIAAELVTPDEVPDPQDLLVEAVRDGEVTAWQSTRQMIFPIAFLIHYLSQVMTLEAGDVISTGAPQKLPEAQAAHRPLHHGDEVTVRVSGIGRLRTRFLDQRKDDA